jgi:hypothetical protein
MPAAFAAAMLIVAVRLIPIYLNWRAPGPASVERGRKK